MPLRTGRSERAFRENVRELIESFEQKGKIGRTKPKNKAHARRIALAIAFVMRGKGGR